MVLARRFWKAWGKCEGKPSELRQSWFPLALPFQGTARKSGAYVILLLREMTGVSGYKNIKNKRHTSRCYAAII